MLDFDIDKICRVCLQSNLDLCLLFDEQNAVDGVFLSNMISEMTIFTVRRYDDFPHQICFECRDRVRKAYEFKRQFETSHRKLLTYLEKVNKITTNTKPNVSNDKSIQTEDSTLYPCEKCDDKFMNYHSLREHRIVSHKGTANLCRFCHKTFNRIGDLKNHIAVHHPEMNHFNAHVCHICNRKFTRKQHVHRHLEKIHKIENGHLSEDEKNVQNESQSDVDESEILGETEIEYKNLTKPEDECEDLSNNDPGDHANDDDSMVAADDPFSSDEDDKPLSGLKNAINAKHKENISIKEELDGGPTEETPCVPKSEEIETTKDEKSTPVEHSREETSRQFKCTHCFKSFVRSSHLKRHSLSHVEDKPFPCKICDKSFKRSDHLKSHMSKHGETKSFKCESCDRAFSRLDLLKRHTSMKHNNKLQSENSHYCEHCNKSFSSKTYLTRHVRLHDTNSWKCKLCPEDFKSKEALKEHNKSHNMEKPYLCSECGLRFVRNDYLLIHMRRHTGEKPYKCIYCNKGFPRATDLNVHVKYHTGEKPHLCTICGKGFQRSYNLIVHMRVHTGEKPYQCSHCPKTFAQCNDLKAHIRRHTGERFKCGICGMGFIQGYSLTQHKIDMHGIEGEARKGRVCKVQKKISNSEDASDAVDNPPSDIKVEQSTCNIPFIENQFVDQEGVFTINLNMSNM